VYEGEWQRRSVHPDTFPDRAREALAAEKMTTVELLPERLNGRVVEHHSEVLDCSPRLDYGPQRVGRAAVADLPEPCLDVLLEGRERLSVEPVVADAAGERRFRRTRCRMDGECRDDALGG
jgi:hypothetical protein